LKNVFLFRRGVGPSADQGRSAIDLMSSEQTRNGQEARNDLQLDLLEHRDLSDGMEGLAYLRARPDVYPSTS